MPACLLADLAASLDHALIDGFARILKVPQTRSPLHRKPERMPTGIFRLVEIIAAGSRSIVPRAQPAYLPHDERALNNRVGDHKENACTAHTCQIRSYERHRRQPSADDQYTGHNE